MKKILLVPDSEEVQLASVDYFINELVDSILSNVLPEFEVGQTDSRKGRRFQSYDSEVIIPEESLRDAIREVFDRWAED